VVDVSAAIVPTGATAAVAIAKELDRHAVSEKD
jgi:hypothetical protein